MTQALMCESLTIKASGVDVVHFSPNLITIGNVKVTGAQAKTIAETILSRLAVMPQREVR